MGTNKDMANQVRTASPYFIYDAPIVGISGKAVATTVVYCSALPIVPRDIGTALAAHFETATYPQQIWILGTKDLEHQIKAAAVHSDLRDRVPAITRYYNAPNIIGATIDAKGLINLGTEVAVELDDDHSRAVFRPGLVNIFRNHEGVMNASAGYHYIKPSRKHSDHFLRTANVLKYGNEISFMAAALLSHLPDGVVRNIYTDTASINSLAYALASIIEKLNPEYPIPTINSFGSYAGINGEFEIVQETGSVALISASTSGAIVGEIEKSQKLSRTRQIILYFVGELDGSINVLCDLTQGSDAHGYIHRFNSWLPNECPLCDLGQSTVHVGGDQFLPANPTVTSRMIVATDAPNWLSPFMHSVYGKDIVLCHTNTANSDDPHRTLFLNLTGIVQSSTADDSELSKKLTKKIMRHVPAATRWIVHLDDNDSSLLAKRIQTEVGKLGLDIPDDRIVNSADLISGEVAALGGGVALIIASAVATGRSILSLSRSLRRAHEGDPLAFLIVVARMPEEPQWRELGVNLTYADANPREHELNVVEAVYLPPEPTMAGTPWHQEAALWKKLRDDLGPFGIAPSPEALIDAITQRLVVLETAPGKGGLTKQLFLDGQVNLLPHHLRLQPNFAFWKFKYSTDPSGNERTPSQADVFFTTSAILHNLRLTKKSKHATLTRDHNWTVIAPGNFARFNDAIIQASILRCALPRELDYSSNDTLSRHMLSVVEDTLSAVDSIEGAASGEFLLGLALERIRLTSEDLQKLVGSYADVAPSWPILHQALWVKIEQLAKK